MKIAGFSPFSAASFLPASSLRAQDRSTRASAGQDKAAAGQELGPRDKAELQELKARDRQVRQHEQAHLSAAGGLATSGANYVYQKGPDGVYYAVGGEVGIDVSEGRTPEETLRRAQLIRAAAMAPADPSSQDRAVAIQAQQMERQANAEIASRQAEARLDGQSGSVTAGDWRKNEIERLYAASAERSASTMDVFA